MATKEKQGKEKAQDRPADPCEPGEHNERIYYPEVPDAERNPQKRLDKMQEITDAEKNPAKKAEMQFEVDAARHNVEKSKTITDGNQISRPATQKELADGKRGDDQFVKAVCQICGRWREVDHAPNRNHAVEAKSGDYGNWSGSDQMKDNAKFTHGGGKNCSYKVPADSLSEDQIVMMKSRGFSVISV